MEGGRKEREKYTVSSEINFLRSRSVSQVGFELLDSSNPQLSMCFDYKLNFFFILCWFYKV